jgi:hypothetical protein
LKNDSLALWKLKEGKAFLNAYLDCAKKIRKGEKNFIQKRLDKFIRLGLLHHTPAKKNYSTNYDDCQYKFTLSGMSIYNQLSLLVNRGIIYQNNEGKYIWRNFQFIEA